MEFTDLVRTTREKQHSSPRRFHQAADLPCSYFYYTKVEKGAVPELPLAMAIIKALGINLRRGLYAWTRAQMPDDETRALFADIGDATTRSAEQTSFSRSLVVNRMQARLLATNPVFWEILVFISCHFEAAAFTGEQLAQRFKMDGKEMLSLLAELYEYGLLERDSSGRFFSKEWFYIPYEREFHPLRELNFRRSLEKFLSQSEEHKYRTTITRLVTPEQERQIHSYIDALSAWIIDLPDEHPPSAVPYTMGVFASQRGFGNA